MAFDALFKKYFSLVVLGLVALVAYFQASGTTALLGASLTEPVASTEPVSAAPSRAFKPRPPRRNADPLINRNPFDSVTGPLNKPPPSPVAAPDPEPQVTDPLKSPVCSDVKVQIVTESDDPEWSFAALQGNGDPMPQLRRVGDSVGNRQVAYIGFNPVEASPAVWLTAGSELCQALLFAKQPEISAQPQAAAAPQGEAPAEAPPPKGAKPVPDDIKNKIQKVSDSEFHVDRSVVDKILADQAELMRSARIVPEKKDGKVVGIRLFGIRQDTLLGTLGFQNGDRLETINGFDMASPEKALEAYARLRTANNLAVKINRRGQSQSIDYRIK